MTEHPRVERRRSSPPDQLRQMLSPGAAIVIAGKPVVALPATTPCETAAEPARTTTRAAAIAGLLAKGLRRARRRIGRLVAGDADELQAEIDTIKRALDHVGRGIQMIDKDGRVVVANKQAVDMLGVNSKFLANKPLLRDVIMEQWKKNEFAANDPAHTAQLLAVRDQLIKSEAWREAGRYERLRPDGKVIEVDCVPLGDGGVVRTHTDITERHEAEQKVKHLAHHDFLTGLANRAKFQEAVVAAIESGESFGIILIDIDYFKKVNDTHGHAFGDALLKEVATRVKATVRDTDMVARLGGDELALLITPMPTEGVGERIAAAIVKSMGKPLDEAGKILVPSVSVGLAAIPETVTTRELRNQAIWRADMALYSAKEAGRGRWHAFDPTMAERELAERTLLEELRTAIAENQFEVFYQPIMNVAANRISGFEALIRWHHPQRGLLAAGEFLPTVESTGLILQLGQWVLQRACQDAMQWPEHVRLLVNLSPRQLANCNLVESVRQTLAATGLDPRRLELEITESSMMQSTSQAEEAIAVLRGHGIRIALDDFGTGYSSLSHIRTLHFDTIKIDRSFVAEAASRPDCAAVVRAVVCIAHELDLETVAEGVETKEQLEWIRKVGCTEAQGYLFSKPVPIGKATALANQRQMADA